MRMWRSRYDCAALFASPGLTVVPAPAESQLVVGGRPPPQELAISRELVRFWLFPATRSDQLRSRRISRSLAERMGCLPGARRAGDGMPEWRALRRCRSKG